MFAGKAQVIVCPVNVYMLFNNRSERFADFVKYFLAACSS